MGIITSAHGLPRPQAPHAPAGQANYCYLFPELANRPDAGLFPGTTAQQTLARLRSFEEVYRQYETPTRRMQLPAAYTYFGQFMNHDLSAPASFTGPSRRRSAGVIIGSGEPPDLSLRRRPRSIRAILARMRNEQQNSLMLDSLYADGPRSADPEVRALYDADGVRFRLAKAITLSKQDLAVATVAPARVMHRHNAYDIPRDAERNIALIADRRNDENLILSQLHLALMLLHNKAAALLKPTIRNAEKRFAAARQLLTQHYHWCILNDFLPSLLSAGAVAHALSTPPRPTAGEVPVEFTTAAFRFGHSMVSQLYDFNDNFGEGGRVSGAAKLNELFAFTSHGRMGPFAHAATQLPDHWVADWNRLTQLSGSPRGGADRIDMSLAADMLNHMPHAGNLLHASIFFRNVMRGFFRRISFGQDYARACGLKPLSVSQVLSAMPGKAAPAAAAAGLGKNTPAWLYFMCEADVLEGGEKLGPTASRIIAETIVGLIRHHGGTLAEPGGRVWHPRQSILRTRTGKPLDSLRMLLLCAEEEQP
jgi:hypothetical protein